MIFITVGSQKFQFNRLLSKIDSLIANKIINEKVFAQIGYSDYLPKNFEYKKFLTREEFNKKISESELIITHAGTGVIVNSIKLGKKVIAVPRLSKYGEHIDDHQIQIVKEFESLNFICGVYDIDNLADSINLVKNKEFNKYISNNEKIIENIIDFIENK